MQAKKIIILFCALTMTFSGYAQRIANDTEKRKQWQSMENGPWDFSPTGTIISCTTSIPVLKCTGNGQVSNQASVSASKNPNPTSSASCLSE